MNYCACTLAKSSRNICIQEFSKKKNYAYNLSLSLISFFGYDRFSSVTAILLDLQLPSFDALLYNYKFLFSMQFTHSGNAVVKYLVSIGL